MTFLPKRRPILPEALLLLCLATAAALLVNVVRSDGLPLFQDWTSPDRQAGQRETVTMDEALSLHAKGAALFLDARSFSEFRDTHIPGAGQLSLEGSQSSGPVPLIVYCSNEDCAKARTLAHELIARGLQVVYLPEGISGWLTAGGPLEGQ